jgi:hypothetical protein
MHTRVSHRQIAGLLGRRSSSLIQFVKKVGHGRVLICREPVLNIYGASHRLVVKFTVVGGS